MTVSSATNDASFIGNDVTDTFPLPFRFFANSDITAQLIETATGAVTPLALGVDYTLTGAGEPEINGSATGVLSTTAPVPTGSTLFVLRELPLTQPTDIVNQGPFFPEVHENVFDRLTMQIQQTVSGLGKSLRVQPSEPSPSFLPNIAQRALKLLSFDEDGNPIAVAPSDGSAEALAIDLANSSDPTKGAGIPAFNRELGYQAGSVGEELNLINRSRAIAVIDYGLIPDGVTDQTAAIQAVIDQFDGPGENLRIQIADGIKFTLAGLTHNATSSLAVEYRFNDDLAFPNSAVGGSQQHMLYVDSGVSGIADNNTSYHSAPYHPASLLDMRSDINSLWVTAAQRRTSINGSYIISREGYTRMQFTYRDFDLDGSDNPDTNARKSGIDLSLWRAQWTLTGITSASWGVPPVAGNLVETADGRLFVVRFIDGAGMILYHRKGNLQTGDTLFFNGVESSTAVTGTPARVLTSLLNRMCVNGYDGAVGFNMPPERVVNANLGIGGILGVEKGSGSLYGTSDPALQCFDVLAAPTKGFYQKYNVTTGAWELYTHANVLMATISTSGTLQLVGGVAANVYSAAQLNSAAHAVNTDMKRQGKMVIRVTDSRPVFATGSAATATWVFADGTLAHTPV